jgi:alpha-amylase/alpha-mannosidase (GH57 family)
LKYARWQCRDAAAHFMSEVVTLHERAPEGLIPVFLDGENAWEYYPYNGWYFFNDLYESLAHNPAIRTLTLSEAARRPSAPTAAPAPPGRRAGVRHPVDLDRQPRQEPRLGNAVRGQAMCRPCAGTRRRTRANASRSLRRLAICESSDWFWWLGDYNASESVACFDRLFRDNIRALYRLLASRPGSLDHPISRGGGAPESGGTMRRAT